MVLPSTQNAVSGAYQSVDSCDILVQTVISELSSSGSPSDRDLLASCPSEACKHDHKRMSRSHKSCTTNQSPPPAAPPASSCYALRLPGPWRPFGRMSFVCHY
jgi:hypothetical protein